MGIKKDKVGNGDKRAQKKAVRLAQKKEGVLQRKRDSLARELAYGVITRKKIEEAQQTYLHEIQKADLKAEFEPIMCYYDKILDMKDFAINLLLVELNEAEIQNQINLKAYWSNMDKLFGGCVIRLGELRENYLNDILDLKKNLIEEINILKAQAFNNEDNLKIMQYGLTRTMRDFIDEDVCNNTRIIDGINRKRSIASKVDLATFDRKLNEYWCQIETEVAKYHSESQHKKLKYDICFAEDTAVTNEIIMNQALLFRLTVTSRRMKDLVKDQKFNEANLIAFYERDYQYLADLNSQIQGQFIMSKKVDHKNLTLLVKESNHILEYLTEKRKQLGKILRWYALTRKHESLAEKIFPYPVMLPEDIKNIIVDPKFYANFLPDEDESPKIYSTFYNKVAQIDRTRYCLVEEKKFLYNENKKIKNTMQHMNLYNLLRRNI